MRITQVMLSKGFGGAERHFVELSRELAARGVEVQAICHERFCKRAELDAIAGVSVAPIPIHGNWDLLARRRIARLLSTFAPHCVHTHLARAALFAGDAARRLDVPVLANVHTRIRLRYYNTIDHFVCATASQVHYLAAVGIGADRLTLIPHFSALRASPDCAGGDPLVFAALGRFVAKKGFDILIDALRLVRTQGINARLVLAGDGPERGELKRRVSKCGLEAWVGFPGWVDDPYTIFQHADIFVLPSLSEPFGIVLLEAMAARMPIVTTRTEGPLEIVDDRSAYFADIGSAKSLAAAMSSAAADSGGRHAKAGAALQRFTKRFTPAVVVPQYLDLYAHLKISEQLFDGAVHADLHSS